MWMRQLPWFFIRRLAKARGFLDPVRLFSQFQRFSQPSEVALPIEILRLASILHARGLLNSQAIQHNLDWVWPLWVERQFDPHDRAFIPRAFSISHINLTHRNWTAVGIPNCSLYPIVDPAGLVTPFLDSWSIDSWILLDSGEELIPSRVPQVSQQLLWDKNLAILTETRSHSASLISKVEVLGDEAFPVCQIQVKAAADLHGWGIITLRPYNPEGISFIHRIDLLEGHRGWKIDKERTVFLNETPDRCIFSDYRHGDVYRFLPQARHREVVVCEVGMGTAAALYELKPGQPREIQVSIPLKKKEGNPLADAKPASYAAQLWEKNLSGSCELKIPEPQFQFLYEAALRTVLLHSPEETYPGPYTYKHFWFRDAAFILHALLEAGHFDRAEKVIDSSFFSRQNPFGYFHSQDGEWDSNGQVLWILRRFCELTGRKPKPEWKKPLEKGAKWIERKRIKEKGKLHTGLLPPGFSAEHLGPNDFYYWDDFWGVAGLSAASYFSEKHGDPKQAQVFQDESQDFLKCIEQSLSQVEKRFQCRTMPASPYRRMDTGAIGSLAGGYPLQLWEPQDARLLETVDYLMRQYFVHGGFFHDMSHSGINPYLTLHIAQILLRAGDPRFYSVMKAVADLASPTGQWPEAIHPQTKGGCMGDGQHVWAAAEWMMMIRNCFVREEKDRLILFSGIPAHWLESKEDITFGPAPTSFGTVRLALKYDGEKFKADCQGEWHSSPPQIEIRLPEHVKTKGSLE